MSGPAPELDARELPTYAECVIGYRAWRASEDDQLWPLHSDRRPWFPGANTARCNCATSDRLHFDWSLINGRRVLEPTPAHAAPTEGCTCGLYSWRYPEEIWSRPGLVERHKAVVGAVACWGRMQVHSDRFRSERACVVVIAEPPEATAAYKEQLERLAARYRAELVALASLEAAATEHGAPLPDELRPLLERATPEEDPAPAPEVPHAPDAAIEEVGTPPPKVGFNGTRLAEPLSDPAGYYGH